MDPELVRGALEHAVREVLNQDGIRDTEMSLVFWHPLLAPAKGCSDRLFGKGGR